MKEVLLLMGGFCFWVEDGRWAEGEGCCLRIEFVCRAGAAIWFNYCFMSRIFCFRRVILLRLEFMRNSTNKNYGKNTYIYSSYLIVGRLMSLILNDESG
jgi:hypothetical protein